jgi:hypothetical protein
VVGDRDRRHALILGLFDQRFDARGPVEHRVFAVHVQVYEGVGCHGSRLPSGTDASARARRCPLVFDVLQGALSTTVVVVITR